MKSGLEMKPLVCSAPALRTNLPKVLVQLEDQFDFQPASPRAGWDFFVSSGEK